MGYLNLVAIGKLLAAAFVAERLRSVDAPFRESLTDWDRRAIRLLTAVPGIFAIAHTILANCEK